ncbi:MAG TPA: sulfite exporter TauE/SafE family protein [Terriglobia bacterium]|nr:sulfite exporter TauE/SafE family protein [Terriglobia bacterium]
MHLDVAQGQHRLPRYATAPVTDALNWLRLGLGGTALVFLAVVGRALAGDPVKSLPSARQTGVGFFTNFFDTLGIGSFAPTTALFRLMRMVDDRLIPSTLNVGHAIPTIVQALIYTSLIEVDRVTLVSMIAASALGAWLGAGIVARWPKRTIQTGIGIALLAAALLMSLSQSARRAIGDRGIGEFHTGRLMTLGIGLSAPCMILVSLLGMSPTAAFPIMMGSCAFLMPVGGLRFVREGSYDSRTAVGLTLGGIPGVLLAAYFAVSMSLYTVRWLVIAVVIYTSIHMLWQRPNPD